MNKPFVFLFAFTCLAQLVHSQSDSVKIFGRKELVRGIYKNYQEFVNNAPSIKEQFSVTQLIKSKDDSTVIAAYYSLVDSSKKIKDPIWGFCDGASVFIRYEPLYSISKLPYWKLECIGLYSYFSIASKDVTLIGPGLVQLITGALSFAGPVRMECLVLDPKGKVSYANVLSTEKYLSPQKELKKSFLKDSEPYVVYEYGQAGPETDEIYAAKVALIKKYLLKLNEALVSSKGK